MNKVLEVLRARKRMTAAELRTVSGLPRRTVYQALRVLRERGAVAQRGSLQDSRQTYFWLVPADDAVHAPATASTATAAGVPHGAHDTSAEPEVSSS